MKVWPLIALGSVVVLSACGGAARHCTGELEYQKAETLPPPAAVDGLSVPQSASALQIPPAPKQPVGFARTVQDETGAERTECLDMPPRMRVTEEPPEAVIGSPTTPAPTAAPAP